MYTSQGSGFGMPMWECWGLAAGDVGWWIEKLDDMREQENEAIRKANEEAARK